MMFNELFPSKVQKADDYSLNEERTEVIRGVRVETMGNERKPVVHFNGAAPLVLNVTNGSTLNAAFGNDTDDWVGRSVVIYRTTTEFQGKVTPCLRLRIAKGAARQPVEPLPPAPVEDVGSTDSIPF